MMQLIIGFLACIFLVIITVTIHYEALHITWQRLPYIHIKPRLKILAVATAIFASHTLTVWVYGVFYWIAANFMDIGTLEFQTGGIAKDFLTCIYFSASTYSSLGYGDVIPTGEIRLVAGTEVLNGLVLIGWSASFTYLAMERFWESHKKQTS